MNKGLILAVLLAVSGGLILRCPQLNTRPMHNDEGVNAVKLGQLLDTGRFRYDPNEHHGPTLFYWSALTARVSGASTFRELTEARLRAATVLVGIAVVLVPLLLRQVIGSQAVGWSILFAAVSPAMVFYSRYYIHEMLLVFFVAVAVAAGWKYWRSRHPGWILVAGVAAGLAQATKETFLISLVAAVCALAANHVWNRLLDASKPARFATPLNWVHLVAAIVLCLFVAALLFSSFFSNPAGPLDALRTYTFWGRRAAGESPHVHGWAFYFQRLLLFHSPGGPIWSEALVFILAVVGTFLAFARKGLGEADASFTRFVAFYAWATVLGYSFIAYKTPWCLLNFWQPMLLLAGVGAAAAVRAAWFQWARLAMSVLLVAGAAQLAAQAWQTSHRYAADPRNPYVYAQTSPDVTNLIEEIREIARCGSEGADTTMKVIAAEGDYWPLPWYLREFKNVGWYDSMPAAAEAQIVIMSSSLHAKFGENRAHWAGYFQLRPGVFLEVYVQAELWRKFLERDQAGQSRG